jgi:two-component system, OmpR family, response regulator RegX3
MIRVLLVEDEKMLQTLIATIFKNEGIELEIAETGVDAIMKYSEDSDRVVILDMSLPDMCGLKIYNALRTIKEDPTIIVSSGRSCGEDIDYILNFENTTSMTKPYRCNDLVALVKEIHGN